MPASALTDRQIEILRLVVDVGIKGAAAELGLSPWTVHEHLARARERTGSATQLQLIAWADDHVPGWRASRQRA